MGALERVNKHCAIGSLAMIRPIPVACRHSPAPRSHEIKTRGTPRACSPATRVPASNPHPTLSWFLTMSFLHYSPSSVQLFRPAKPGYWNQTTASVHAVFSLPQQVAVREREMVLLSTGHHSPCDVVALRVRVSSDRVHRSFPKGLCCYMLQLFPHL